MILAVDEECLLLIQTTCYMLDPESDRPFSVNVSQLRLWGHPLGVQHPQTPLVVASDAIENRGVGVFTLDEQAMRFTTITGG